MSKKWKDTEKIVAAFERRISKEASIEHDVIMKDLTGDSDGRQCDIVIKSGGFPRETITIVEVQDRKSQIDITTFDGFISKMKSVGAQHLIVVSKHDFPKSVKRRAGTLGPTVRLINLTELIDEKFAIEFIDNEVKVLNHNVDEFTIRFKDIDSERDAQKIADILESGKFRLQRNSMLYTPYELLILCLKNTSDSYEEGTRIGCINIPKEEGIYLESLSDIPIGIEYRMTVTTVMSKLDLKCFEYKQLDIAKPLLWYAEGTGSINGEKAKIGLSFKFDETTLDYERNIEVLEGPFQDLVIELIRV